ncbi:MAG: hypothetical protein ABI741_07055 [Ferruginibacter sp.]
MDNNLKISKTELGYTPHNIFNDMATKNKIDKHLLDINDIISEDDIRNIKVSIPDLSSVHFVKEDGKRRKMSTTPWDILDIEA